MWRETARSSPRIFRFVLNIKYGCDSLIGVGRPSLNIKKINKILQWLLFFKYRIRETISCSAFTQSSPKFVMLLSFVAIILWYSHHRGKRFKVIDKSSWSPMHQWIQVILCYCDGGIYKSIRLPRFRQQWPSTSIIPTRISAFHMSLHQRISMTILHC